MKNLLAKWQDTSYIKKTLILLIAILLVTPLTYVVSGCPPLTAKMALRQAELRNMVGPSQIIAEFQQESIIYKDVIIGRTAQVYTLFSYSKKEQVSAFAWYERTDNMALYAIPGSFPRTTTIADVIPLNLILFDTEPKAKRAEIELELTYQHNHILTKSFSAEAVREHDGFFILPIYVEDDTVSMLHSAGLEELRKQCTEYGANKVPVTVRLYDKNDQLIRTETIFAGPSS